MPVPSVDQDTDSIILPELQGTGPYVRKWQTLRLPFFAKIPDCPRAHSPDPVVLEREFRNIIVRQQKG